MGGAAELPSTRSLHDRRYRPGATVSLQAMTWVLDCSEAAGADRLVMVVMAHHCDAQGFVGLSRAVLADETRMSDNTAKRCQDRLVDLGEISPVHPADAPDWWLGITTNRRPRLFRLALFIDSPYGAPIRRRLGAQNAPPSTRSLGAQNGPPTGGALGGHWGPTGGPLLATPPPPSRGSATRSVSSDQRTEKALAGAHASDAAAGAREAPASDEVLASPPPWTRGDMTFDEWVRSGAPA